MLVAVAGSPSKPAVLERRRIETADTAISGSVQPFHAAKELPLEKAEAHISKCREGSALLATGAVFEMIAELAQKGYTVVGTAILFASGRPLPDLASILRSHPVIHTAEGEFSREILISASEQCNLPVSRIKERDAWEKGAAMFRLDPAGLRQKINQLGRTLGPPWTQDEKLASLAGWIALSTQNSKQESKAHGA